MGRGKGFVSFEGAVRGWFWGVEAGVEVSGCELGGARVVGEWGTGVSTRPLEGACSCEVMCEWVGGCMGEEGCEVVVCSGWV